MRGDAAAAGTPKTREQTLKFRSFMVVMLCCHVNAQRNHTHTRAHWSSTTSSEHEISMRNYVKVKADQLDSVWAKRSFGK